MTQAQLARRREMEREITSAAIEAAIKRGWILHYVNNGEDAVTVTTTDEAIKAAFECDEAHIYFQNAEHAGRAWMYIVLGNTGYDVISDYTVNLSAAIDDIDALVDKCEEEAFTW